MLTLSGVGVDPSAAIRRGVVVFTVRAFFPRYRSVLRGRGNYEGGLVL